MNDVQERIKALWDKGWTLAAMADELEVSRRGIASWQSGERYPENVKGVLVLMDQLLKRRLVPKQRRYAPGSRRPSVDA